MMFVLALALAAAQPTPASAPTPAPSIPTAAAPDYRQDGAWLCLPGRSDACSQALPTVALNPNGYGANGEARPNPDAPADCFYVYPTVSRDPGTTSDLTPGQEEIAAAYTQVARFAGVCRPYAPIYRQLTLPALFQALSSGDPEAAVADGFEIGSADVKAAFADFLRRTGDRPFVLVGHSQGSGHLVRLIEEEIDGKPVARRMLSAILLGWNVEVPTDAVVGGTFRSTPLCTRLGEIGCVVTYVSFRKDAPPPEATLFGRAREPGRTVGCTNPATLARGPAALDSYWFTRIPQPVPITWSSEGDPPAPFVRTEGLVTAECVNDGPLGYLALTVPPTPDDARTDRIPGDVMIAGERAAGWGTHRADMPAGQGSLIRLVEAQAEAWARRPR